MRRALIASLFASLVSVSAGAVAQDIGSSVESICCGTECCLIAGECLMRGDTNPEDATQFCDPAPATNRCWSDGSGCVPEPDAGAAPDAGTAPVDAGTPPADAGTSPDDGGCSVAAGSRPGFALGAFGLVAAGLLLRRRR